MESELAKGGRCLLPKINDEVKIKANGLPGKIIGIWTNQKGTSYQVQYVNNTQTICDDWLMYDEIEWGF